MTYLQGDGSRENLIVNVTVCWRRIRPEMVYSLRNLHEAGFCSVRLKAAHCIRASCVVIGCRGEITRREEKAKSQDTGWNTELR